MSKTNLSYLLVKNRTAQSYQLFSLSIGKSIDRILMHFQQYFQLYIDSYFYWWRKPEYHRPIANNGQPLSDVTNNGQPLSDVTSNGLPLSDVTSNGQPLSDVISNGQPLKRLYQVHLFWGGIQHTLEVMIICHHTNYMKYKDLFKSIAHMYYVNSKDYWLTLFLYVPTMTFWCASTARFGTVISLPTRLTGTDSHGTVAAPMTITCPVFTWTSWFLTLVSNPAVTCIYQQSVMISTVNIIFHRVNEWVIVV